MNRSGNKTSDNHGQKRVPKGNKKQLKLALQLPIIIDITFLLAISIDNQERRLWETIRKSSSLEANLGNLFVYNWLERISRLTELIATMMLVKFISHFMYIIIIIWDILVTISIYNQDLVKNTIDYIWGTISAISATTRLKTSFSSVLRNSHHADNISFSLHENPIDILL